MNPCGCEPTLAEILSDPVIHAVMHADGIHPPTLEAELKAMARTLNLFGPPHVTTAAAQGRRPARHSRL